MKFPLRALLWISCAIFFSSPFWMRNSVDYAGWSVMEAVAWLLLMTFVVGSSALKVPARSLRIVFLLLILYAAASLAWSCNFHATLTGTYKIIFVGVMFVNFCQDRNAWLETLGKALPLFALCAAACFLFLPVSRLTWMDHPNLMGGFIAIGGVMSLGLYFETGKKWALVGAGVLGLALFLMASLAPLLAWAVGTAILCLSQGKKKIRAFALFAAAAFAVSFLAHGVLKDRPYQNILMRRRADAFASERLQIWKDSLTYFSKHLFLGTGLGTFRDVYPEFKSLPGERNAPYAHNEILNLLCELGLTGFLILLGGAACFDRASRGDRARPAGFVTGLAVLAAASLQSLFDFNLRYPATLLPLVFFAGFLLPDPEPIDIRSRSKKAALLAACFLMLLLQLLPGMAGILFRKGYEGGPDSKRKAALWAQNLDPFNALYRFESGRMRDVDIAIGLEPRNVWYRRQAAKFLAAQGRTGPLEEAIRHYDAILSYAPGVPLFESERGELLQKSIQKTQKN